MIKRIGEAVLQPVGFSLSNAGPRGFALNSNQSTKIVGTPQSGEQSSRGPDDTAPCGIEVRSAVNRADGPERILVMDDDDIVRKVMRGILEHSGYGVHAVENGDEAIDCYREALACGCPFDAVIVDIYIPRGRGGRETIEGLRDIDGGVKAIVMSGMPDDPLMSDFRKYGFRNALKKPFQGDHLLQAVRTAIDESRDLQSPDTRREVAS